MPDFDMFRIIQVGYRAGDFQDTVIGTGGKIKPCLLYTSDAADE